MSKRDINIFGTSFLDLLSGALAAVIILYVIVPKKSQADVEVLEKVEQLEIIAEDIETITEKLRNSVPKDVLEQIESELKQLEEKTAELKAEVQQLEAKVKDLLEENRELKQTVAQQAEEIERLKRELAEAREKLEEAEKKKSKVSAVEETLGVFAKFAILCRWDEGDIDVDLGVQRFGNQEQCWRMYPSKPWGILGEDVRTRVQADEERFELFYVPEIYSDEYTAFLMLYDGKPGRNANVSASLVFHPGKPDQQVHEIHNITVSCDQATCFVTFRLTESGFTILPHREPLWGSGTTIK